MPPSMIKRFIRRVLGLPADARRVPREKHGLARERISPAAPRSAPCCAKRLLRLRRGRRGARPAARHRAEGLRHRHRRAPEQIKPLFRRALIIGRRFRLVHVMMGRRRSRSRPSAPPIRETSEKDEHGRVLRDNVFGTQEEDARRRDFTVNALYYDPRPRKWSTSTAAGRPEEARAARDRRPGDALSRGPGAHAARGAAGREARPDARAGTRAPIRRIAPLMERVPPARLFDEMLKLLLSGTPAPACAAARGRPAQGLLPLLDVILEQPLGERFVTLALAQTDERVLAERPVSPAFLFAALLWHEVLAAWKARESAASAPSRRSRARWTRCSTTQCEKLAITRKLTATMREVWAMQPRFEQRSGSAPIACSKRRASAWPTTSSRCARRAARCRPSSRPGGARSRAPTRDAQAMLLPEYRSARSAAGARRASAGPTRQRRTAEPCVTLAYVGHRLQPGRPAQAGARRFEELDGCRSRASPGNRRSTARRRWATRPAGLHQRRCRA
jgi:poly(A) polymerase